MKTTIEIATEMLQDMKTVDGLVKLLEYCEENHLDIVASRKMKRFGNVGTQFFSFDVYDFKPTIVYFLLDNEYDKHHCAIRNLKNWAMIEERPITEVISQTGYKDWYSSDAQWLRKTFNL